MKRPFATTLVMSLAALALAATAPVAVATPSLGSPTTPPPGYSAPTAPPSVDPDHPVVRATATGPTSKTGTATINVTGVYPGDRLEAQAIPAAGGGDSTARVFETGGPNETAVFTLPAPAGGWKSQTRYGWFVLDTDHGLADQGHFTTPAWPGEEVGVWFDAEVKQPTTRKGTVVFTITGAKPGIKVEAGLSRSTDGYTNGPWASAVADAEGRAVVTVRAEGAGWDANTRYIWWARSEELSSNGSFTMPDWTTVTPAPTKPAPTKPAPSKPAPPKDSGGGLAKTGL